MPQVKGGVGLGIFSQKIGVQSLNKISLNYAFIQPIRNIKLSIGLRGGMIFSKLDGSKLITPNGDYQNGTNHEDPILPNVITNSLRPDLGTVSYTHLRAHETVLDLVCRLLLEKKKK